MEAAPLRAYLVDDEPLAIERLTRMLTPFDNIQIAASANDPTQGGIKSRWPVAPNRREEKTGTDERRDL